MMNKRSLKISLHYLQKVKNQLDCKGMTQKQLADFAGCSPQPVSKFFTGKPVERTLFIIICQQLDLDYQEVIDICDDRNNFNDEILQTSNLDINALVREVRQKIHQDVISQCGTMRVLDMSDPVEVSNIYTKVNILEKVTERERKQLSQLIDECDRQNHDRWQLSNVNEPRVAGLEVVKNHARLMILGKPGAGKTTFLKHLAIECISNNFLSDLVPFFVRLKDFAESDNNYKLSL